MVYRLLSLKNIISLRVAFLLSPLSIFSFVPPVYSTTHDSISSQVTEREVLSPTVKPMPKSGLWLVSGSIPAAYHQYYDVPAWNCNGSKLLFRSESERDVYMISRIGEEPCKIEVHPKMGRGGDNYVQWDVSSPDVFYYVAYDIDQAGTYLVKQSLSGTMETIYINPSILRLAVPHPNGIHLLFHAPLKKSNDAIIYSLENGETIPVKMPGNVHRVRFTKQPDLSVFCNLSSGSDHVGGSWINTVDGENINFYTDRAGHPDWSPNGELFSFFSGGLHIVNRNGEQISFLGENIGGHQSWSYDGKSIVVDVYGQPVTRLHSGQIVIVDVETMNTTPVVPHNSEYNKSQSSHPHPYLSPDGTKVVFNSNSMGANSPQVFVALVKEPEGVSDLNVAIDSQGIITLKWKMPESREIGSVIIRSIDKDGFIKEIANVEGNEWKGKLLTSIHACEIITMERSGIQGKIERINIPK